MDQISPRHDKNWSCSLKCNNLGVRPVRRKSV